MEMGGVGEAVHEESPVDVTALVYSSRASDPKTTILVSSESLRRKASRNWSRVTETSSRESLMYGHSVPSIR